MNYLRPGLALVGFVLAVFGVALGHQRLVWSAIAVLLISLVLRLMRRRANGSSSTEG